MDPRSEWVVFAVVVAGVAVIGCLVLALVLPGLGWAGFGSGGPFMRGERMQGMCPWCRGTGYQTPWGSVTGTVAILSLLALPVGLIVLVILGGVWLVRSITPTPSPGHETETCPSCGEEVEPGWKACPHCGESLTE